MAVVSQPFVGCRIVPYGLSAGNLKSDRASPKASYGPLQATGKRMGANLNVRQMLCIAGAVTLLSLG